MATLVAPGRLRAFFFPERGIVLPRPYAVVAALGIALGIALAFSDVGQRLEWSVYDGFMRAQAAGSPPAPDVVVVAIDEPSFSQVGLSWPWPRSLHGALVEQLVAGGARSIAFDIVFDAPGVDEDADDAFAEAIREAGNVVLGANYAVLDDPRYVMGQWVEPLDRLARAASAVAAIGIPYDPDGVIRRAALYSDNRPSLALGVASRQPGFQAPLGLDPTGAHLFRFNGAPRHGIETVSYYQALDAANSLPAGIFKDKHVLVGRSLSASPIDQPDHFETPVGVLMAGVEIHATIVDALLRRRFVAEPLASPAAVAILCVVLATVASVGLFFTGPLTSAAIVAFAVVGLLVGGYAVLTLSVQLPVVAPALVILTSYGATAVYRFALSTRERRMIRRAFQFYVAPAIVDEMLTDPSKLKLGGQEYEVTVLFSDLEGFSGLAERLTPTELSAHLREYFRDMLDVLMPQRGTLDKLIGDSIMMYFGCPIPDAQHAVRACRGALATQARMAALNNRWQRHLLPPLKTRIGINTGLVVAGNMGTDTIFNYTVIGDSVNLASRLEGVNKEYGTLIIVGEDTWRRVSDLFEGRELDWIRVKGRQTPVSIYELVAEKGALDDDHREALAHFAEGLRLYRDQRWSAARAAFDEALRLRPDDGPSATFAIRCAEYEQEAPADWDGVHVMTRK